MSEVATEPRLVAWIPKNARESVHVTLENFKGYDLCSLRVWAYHPEREEIPTRNGFAIRIELLPELVAALQEAERQAREAGLLVDDGGSGDG